MPEHCFGEIIRQHRLDDERSLRYIAQRAGISTTHLWQIEVGQSEPSLRVALAIAHAIGVPLEQLVLQPDLDANPPRS